MAIVALSRVSHRDGYIPRTLAWRNGRILKQVHVYPCVFDGTHSRIKNGSSSLYNDYRDDYRIYILQVFLRKNTILTKCAHLAGKWIVLSPFSRIALNSRPSFSRVVFSFPEFRWRFFLADARPDRVSTIATLCFFSPRRNT